MRSFEAIALNPIPTFPKREGIGKGDVWQINISEITSQTRKLLHNSCIVSGGLVSSHRSSAALSQLRII